MSQTPLRPVTPSGLLAATLARAHDRLEHLGGDAEVLADLRRARDLAHGLDPYLGACTTPESAALAGVTRRTRALEWPDGPPGVGALEAEMLSGHVEGQLLKFLVHATRAVRVLEIGMFTGYSALAMAEALPERGTVVACEVDADIARVAQQGFDASTHGTKVQVRVGDAAHTLAALVAAGERFDLVFVDADKAGYLGYLDQILGGGDIDGSGTAPDAGLLTAGGIVCVDNTLMQGEPWASEHPSAPGAAIARFNEHVAADPRVEQVLVPLRDGVTLIRRATVEVATS